jgi:hypothetical protein
MRRRGVALFCVLVTTATACNAILGIGDPIEPRDGDASTTESGSADDARGAFDSSGSEASAHDASSTDATADVRDANCGVDANGDDPLHCGACFHSCQGGDCVAGECQVVVLAKDYSYPYGIAVDDTNVYWSNFGGVSNPAGESVDKADKRDGGSWVQIASMVSPQTLGLGATDVFITGGGVIAKAGKNGIPTGATWVTAATASGIAVDKNAVYWSTGTGVMSEPLSGIPAPAPLVSGEQGTVAGVAVDATYLYWITNDVTGQVRAAMLDGSSKTTLATGNKPFDVIADGTYVYWSVEGDNSIWRLPAGLGGGAPTKLAAVNGPRGLAADAEFVYFVTAGGVVGKAPISGGGNVTILAHDLGDLRRLAVDTTNVYFTTFLHPDGQVLRVAK